MSTNYYLRINDCKHCGRNDAIHIGKISGGHQFVFQAFNEYESSVIFIPVKSVKDWRYLISNPKSTIYDEYGNIIDKSHFWDNIVMPSKGRINYHFKYSDSNSFTDIDGWSFISVDFS